MEFELKKLKDLEIKSYSERKPKRELQSRLKVPVFFKSFELLVGKFLSFGKKPVSALAATFVRMKRRNLYSHRRTGRGNERTSAAGWHCCAIQMKINVGTNRNRKSQTLCQPIQLNLQKRRRTNRGGKK